jgi:hypothetical protein
MKKNIKKTKISPCAKKGGNDKKSKKSPKPKLKKQGIPKIITINNS